MNKRDPFRCIDCDVHTKNIGEYYMVNNDLWLAYVGDRDTTEQARGMLCIGCLEARMTRTLVPSDFSNARLNSMTNYYRSPRLRDRLGVA